MWDSEILHSLGVDKIVDIIFINLCNAMYRPNYMYKTE